MGATFQLGFFLSDFRSNTATNTGAGVTTATTITAAFRKKKCSLT
jgi:hypothetical protein